MLKIEYDREDEAKCLICCDGYGYDDDDIMFCDYCNAPTHQSCYGSELMQMKPESKIFSVSSLVIVNSDFDEWYCQRCQQLQLGFKTMTEMRCFFCPELKGIIKFDHKNGIWVKFFII